MGVSRELRGLGSCMEGCVGWEGATREASGLGGGVGGLAGRGGRRTLTKGHSDWPGHTSLCILCYCSADCWRLLDISVSREMLSCWLGLDQDVAAARHFHSNWRSPAATNRFSGMNGERYLEDLIWQFGQKMVLFHIYQMFSRDLFVRLGSLRIKQLNKSNRNWDF